MTMRITTLILFAAVVVGAGACGAGGSNARDSGGATTAKTEELPEPGPIPKGKYTSDEFEPAFSFEIEERGWQVPLPEDQFALAIHTDSFVLAFLNIPRVYDPKTWQPGSSTIPGSTRSCSASDPLEDAPGAIVSPKGKGDAKPMSSLPTGTVTFTDTEGSTRRWERNPTGMFGALARHDGMARPAIEERECRVFNGQEADSRTREQPA